MISFQVLTINNFRKGIHSFCTLFFFNDCNPFQEEQNSIRDARTPQPGEIVFNTMRYRSSETVDRLGYFQSSVSVQIMLK